MVSQPPVAAVGIAMRIASARLLAVLFLFWISTGAAAIAQPTLAIDLRGDWKSNPSQDPGMADPAFDDSDWAVVRIPFGFRSYARLRSGGWLRKTVDLPAVAESIDRTRLALTLGPLGERYAVYVNGRLIATVGSFDTLSNAQLARPRSFAIPAEALAGTGRQVRIAIRLGTQPPKPRIWTLPDEGPYLLADRDLVPDPGPDAIVRQRHRLTPTIAFSAVYLALMIPLLIAWSGERQRPELLLLALLLLAHAVWGFNGYATVSEDATPWTDTGGRQLQQFFLFGPWMLLTSFVLVALGFRLAWLQAACCLSWLAVLRLYDRNYVTVAGLVLALIACAAVMVAWRRLARDGAPWRKRILVFALVLPVLERTQSAVRRVLSSQPQSITMNGYYFEPGDLGTLALTAAILGVILWQLAADRREKERLAGEFAAARVVQRYFLSAAETRTSNAVLRAVYLPAQEVGGDFYQFLPLAGGGWLIVFGDVSGKGLKAAMVVSLLTGALRNRRSDSPAEILTELNRVAAQSLDGGFVAAVAVRGEPDGRLQIASAGHPAPYLAGREIDLAGAGLPLGIDAEATYEESEWRLTEGDSLVLISDGVIEAANAAGELFGFERAAATVAKTAEEIAETAKVWGQNDDITVVTVRRAS